MITKPESSPATISDVNKSAKNTERVLRDEILRVEEKVENIEERVGTIEESQSRLEEKVDKMGETIEKISNQLDGFVGRVDDLTNDNEIGTEQIHELRDTVKDHGKRISKLEVSN